MATSSLPMSSSSAASAGQLAPGLARKLRKVLEVLSALSALSDFYPAENTPAARRALRATIERRGVGINGAFVAASERAQEALDKVESESLALLSAVDRIASALSESSGATSELVAATERMRQELDANGRRRELIGAFLRSYQLTPDEVVALREDPLDERFFKALNRVHQIHANCKVLLRTHHQRAGLELMDVMAVYQEAAYERLCSDTPEVSDLLRMAARALRDRPVLYKYCAEEVANTRHNALFRRFIGALTRGGPGGTPRPIELHAHDPRRYIGDMLAWLHQALASERELALTLFGEPGALSPTPSSPRENDELPVSTPSAHQNGASVGHDADRTNNNGAASDDDDVSVASVLDRIMEGVCRPFKVRVEQVLTSSSSSSVSASSMGAAGATQSTQPNIVSLWLGDRAALTLTLRECGQLGSRTLFEGLRAWGDRLVRYPPPPPQDLSPPTAVPEAMSKVLEMLEVHEQAMVSVVGSGDFGPVLAAMLDPLLQMCERSAEQLSAKKPPSRRPSSGTGIDSQLQLPAVRSSSVSTTTSNSTSTTTTSTSASDHRVPDVTRRVFLINCLAAIQQPLQTHRVAAARVEAITFALEDHLKAIVDAEVSGILTDCGLLDKVDAARRLKLSTIDVSTLDDDDIPSILSPTAVSESLRALYTRLATGSSLVPECERIQPPRVRSDAANRVGRGVAEAYDAIYAVVADPAMKYAERGVNVRHSPAQIRTILGIS
eukprot:jgi/Chlat1/2733/Chrsp182S02898